jgi:signal transduction histidine kinase
MAAKRPARSRRRLNHRGAPASDERLQFLLDELQSQHEQIVAQNEQLLRAQAEIEAARDHYANLHDLAPLGYVALRDGGVIVEINVLGADMLGRPRSDCLGRSIFDWVAASDHAVLRHYLAASMTTGGEALPPVDVRLHRPKRLIRLRTRSVVGPAARTPLRFAMFDVTEQERLGREREAALAQLEERAEQLRREVADREFAEQRVKRLVGRLVTVQEEERRRLARNLHDHLGQQLTALRFSISALKEQRPVSPEAMRERVESLDRMIAGLDKDVDRLAWDLRPPALDEEGLSPALEELLRQWSMATGIQSEFHSSLARAIRLPPESESHVYRIVQEALNNAGKHAKASCVSVLIDSRSNQLLLTVEDDGCGFDPGQQSTVSEGGLGLIGMQERATLIGGNVAIESNPGKGTTVLIRIPLLL